MKPQLRPTNFRLDPDILSGIEEVKRRDGISITEQVRRALRAWLETKGINVAGAQKKADRRPGMSRSKRS